MASWSAFLHAEFSRVAHLLRFAASCLPRLAVLCLLELLDEDTPKLGKTGRRRVGQNVNDPLAVRTAESDEVVTVLAGQLELCGQLIGVQQPDEQLHLVGSYCDTGEVHVSHPIHRGR